MGKKADQPKMVERADGIFMTEEVNTMIQTYEKGIWRCVVEYNVADPFQKTVEFGPKGSWGKPDSGYNIFQDGEFDGLMEVLGAAWADSKERQAK